MRYAMSFRFQIAVALFMVAAVNINAQRFHLGDKATPAAAPAQTNSAAPAAAEPAEPETGEESKPAVQPPLTDEQKTAVINIAMTEANKAIDQHINDSSHINPASIADDVRAIKSFNFWWHLGEVVLIVAIIAFMVLGKRKGHACIVFATLGFTAAAVQGASINHCETDKGYPPFFISDGTTTKLVCTGTGLAGVKVVTFSDSAVTADHVVAVPGMLKFDLTVGKSAVIGSEPKMLLDGVVLDNTVNEYNIAVLDIAEAARYDLMFRVVKGSMGRSSVSGSDQIFRAGLKAEFENLCSNGCEGKSASELYRLATGFQKGSTAEAFRILERARRNATVEATLRDDRLNRPVAPGVVQTASGPDLQPVVDRLVRVETATSQVVAVQNGFSEWKVKTDQRFNQDEAWVQGVDKLAEVTAGGVIGSKATPKSAKCGIYLALREANPKLRDDSTKWCPVSAQAPKKHKK